MEKIHQQLISFICCELERGHYWKFPCFYTKFDWISTICLWWTIDLECSEVCPYISNANYDRKLFLSSGLSLIRDSEKCKYNTG